jgi:hypothetical protein
MNAEQQLPQNCIFAELRTAVWRGVGVGDVQR